MRITFLLLASLCAGPLFSQNWLTAGNSGTSSSNFVGTTDNQPLIFRANNTEGFRLSAAGNFLLGKTSDDGPKFQLLGRSRFQTNSATGFVISNDPENNHVVYNGATGEFNVYRLRSMNMHTNAEGNSVFNGGYLQFSNNLVMLGYQQPISMLRSHPSFGQPASLIIDNGVDGTTPANYKVLSAKFDGVEVAHINRSGGGQFAGNTLIGTTTASTARLHVEASADNSAGISVKQSSYTPNHNLIEVKNFAGAIISKFDHGGRLIMNNSQSGTIPPFLMATMNMTDPPNFSSIPMVFVTPGGTDQTGIIVRAIPDQLTTRALQEWQASNQTAYMRVMSDGKLALGVSVPTAQLHTSGSIRFAGLSSDNLKTRVLVSDADGNLGFREASTIGGSGSISGTNNYLAKYSGTTAIGNSIVFDNGTSVGIGTINVSETGFQLFVETGIRTRRVKVDQTTWADYVFEKDYKLPTLKEVDDFIRENKHLPGVPSAETVAAEGLDLGDSQAMLLKKIEELTLYVIELKKENERQNEEIRQMKQKRK
ncbi:MAG: hypothetical protein ABW007_21905 [Chitinophagaceae bacterium]